MLRATGTAVVAAVATWVDARIEAQRLAVADDHGRNWPPQSRLPATT